ncbi:MAG: DUF5615 family PIN-like protein [Bacteroidia bacterium]
MNFIVDAQLPKSLSDFLCSKGFDSVHTLQLPEKNQTKDFVINELAANENRVIITKDNDFLESFILKKVPIKLIFVRTGNIKNAALLSFFALRIDKIIELLEENSLLEINKTEIVAHT